MLAGLMSSVKYDAVFMTAAVADYRPSGVWEIVERIGAENAAEQTWKVRRLSGEKISSAHWEIAVVGEHTAKIVDLFRTEWGYGGLLVKFKLEVGLRKDELIAVGEEKQGGERGGLCGGQYAGDGGGAEGGGVFNRQGWARSGWSAQNWRRGWSNW
jgi:hypothetical protein